MKRIIYFCLLASAALWAQARTIDLEPRVYNIDRSESVDTLCYVSNTTSEAENPEAVKHAAWLFRGEDGLVINGNGATLMLDGEMTAMIFDGCKGVVVKDLTIDNLHPTLTEMTVMEHGDDWMKARVHPDSQYRLEDDHTICWYGKGWEFSRGIAQLYDPERACTWRCHYPFSDVKSIEETQPGVLLIRYNGRMPWDLRDGQTFQMRDSYRDEVCALVANCKNVTFDNVKVRFAGNFGIVSQCSEDVTFKNVDFMPNPASGRTAAGYADFLQFSGCKGLITVDSCQFAGSHDDPINVHGTHLVVKERVTPTTLRLRYMHDQTFGFQSFFPGDSIEFVNPATLLPIGSGQIKEAKMDSPREILVTLTEEMPEEYMAVPGLAVENITWTPDVNISNCYFTLSPTRGVLVTTRGKVVIEDNVFDRLPMSAILIADDASGWFESGPVRDVTVRGNLFKQCQGPVIYVHPENRENAGCVHHNLRIIDNQFDSCPGDWVSLKSIDGVLLENNCHCSSSMGSNH